MSISAATISRAVYDKPVQPLFNTIYMSSVNAGIPVIITNTNTNLRVTTKAIVGSVPKGTEITDAMFIGKSSGFEVDGFSLTEDRYFTLLDIETNIAQLPNEFRTDAAGMDDATLAEILITIGNKISESLLANYFAGLQAHLTSVAPASNITTGQAGKIEWNPLLTPSEGTTSITKVIDDILKSLPLTMQVGGAAGTIVTGWISSQDFEILKTATTEAYQQNKNGGFTSNFFQYYKEESSVQESRDMINREFIRIKNLIILPLNGLEQDSLIVTYQQGLENARVFYDKVPATLMNNFYMVIKGAFIRNDNLTVPIQQKAQQAFFNLPYQVGNLLTINKTENAIAKYKVLADLSSGVLLRESDKLFAYLPN